MNRKITVLTVLLFTLGCDDQEEQFDLELVASGCIDASILRGDASSPGAVSECRNANPEYSMDEYGCQAYVDTFDSAYSPCIISAYDFSRDYESYSKPLDIAVLYCAQGVEDACREMAYEWDRECEENTPTTFGVGCYGGYEAYLESCTGKDILDVFGGFSDGVLKDCELLIEAAKTRRKQSEKNQGF